MSKFKVIGPGIIKRIKDDSEIEQEGKSSMSDFWLQCFTDDVIDMEEKVKMEKDLLLDKVYKEAVRFFQRLRRHPSTIELKKFTIEELHIENLVKYLFKWNIVAKQSLNHKWGLVRQLHNALTTLLSETRKRGIKMEGEVIHLFKDSIKLCKEIIDAQYAVEDKNESSEEWEEGERRVEETSNEGDAMTFEKICEKLYYHHSEQQRLLELIGRLKRF